MLKLKTDIVNKYKILVVNNTRITIMLYCKETLENKFTHLRLIKVGVEGGECHILLGHRRWPLSEQNRNEISGRSLLKAFT